MMLEKARSLTPQPELTFAISPAIKIILSMGLILLISFLEIQPLLGLGVLLALVLAAMLMIRTVSIGPMVKRLACVLPFVLLVVVLNFNSQLQVNIWHLLLKSMLSVLVLSMLVATTSFQQILKTLENWHVPTFILMILGLFQRYTVLLQRELEHLRRAVLLRSGHLGFKQRISLYGRLLGILFIRAYDRSERVFQAMTCRGYGEP